MPAFHTLNRTGSLKPVASSIASVTDQTGNEHSALIVQRYGRGRSAVMTVGDFWRWQLKQNSSENAESTDPATNDFGKAWRQLLRWLVADVPARITFSTTPKPEIAPEAISLNVLVQAEDYTPEEQASVELAIEVSSAQHSGESSTVTLLAEPSLEEPGLFHAIYLPRIAGAYRVNIQVKDAEGKLIGEKKSGWVSEPTEKEFEHITPNRELLAKVRRRVWRANCGASNAQRVRGNIAE